MYLSGLLWSTQLACVFEFRSLTSVDIVDRVIRHPDSSRFDRVTDAAAVHQVLR